VAVRDSKNPDDGMLLLTSGTWRRLARQAKAGELDL
jgi:hypothetical protein